MYFECCCFMVSFAMLLVIKFLVVIGLGSWLCRGSYSIVRMTHPSYALENKPPNYASAAQTIIF